MPTIVENSTYATFVNVFTCTPADQDEVVRINAEIIDRVAVGRPGFISASIHRSTDGTRVFNYLQWETPEHLAHMQRSPEFSQVARQLAGLIQFEPHQCEVVHVGETAAPS
ncbi:antibiotic biosynthesis monooxygenase family protein [Conexibacter woesei]|uniref:Antibiotic biosynthesis monooxygenase n=1 Tax=Conexibacter woesei (strain DSM 14684 / CCUG 47730 / CIP 108061 / JCM 11494 / NBRC 100937 / ID131577) TaxID=469383 RepID=D3F750_CONWI|nr:antibiotic biosynthesis monooxygenase [Conexibacter woesei]ADB48821.1 Antibiotic biosynthesis monooxygenase [Conexibacter woesei DSM 14684]